MSQRLVPSAGWGWTAPLLLLCLGLSACGHKQAKIATPPLPPGVTWGGPGSETASSASSASSTAESPVPVAEPLPSSAELNRSSGKIWQEGVASFYGPQEQGNYTASGQIFDYHKMTAAHRLLPLGTRIRVTDIKTGKSVVVTVNDRGPFWPNRILDLTLGAARQIGVYPAGLDRVKIQIVSLPNPLPVGIYTVQVGWFTDTAALNECKQLMQDENPGRVIEFNSSTGYWLRYDKSIRLDMTKADEITRLLREKHFPAYVVRLN